METDTKTKGPTMLKHSFGKRLTFWTMLLCLIGLSKAFAQVPLAPTGLGYGNNTCTAFSATWSVSSGATEYFFDISTDVSFSSFENGYNNLNVGNVNTFYATGLSPNTLHYYRVRAGNSNGISPNSNTITVQSVCGSPFIISPVNGATVTNRCDLQFCVYDSSGSSFNVQIIPDYSSNPVAHGNNSWGNPFCLYPSFDSIPVGTHMFYLVDGGQLLDSISITVANTIYNLESTVTFNHTPANNGGYNYTVNGLSASETYSVIFYDGNANFTDTVAVSNTTSFTYPYQYAHDGDYWGDLWVEADCDGSTIHDSLFVNVNNSNCAAYTDIQSVWVDDGNSNNCLNDSVYFSIYGTFGGLNPSASSTLVISWGDGTTDTANIPHNGFSDTSFYYHTSNLGNHYPGPGVYTAMITLYNSNACYMDTLIQSVVIGGAMCSNLVGTIYGDANSNCAQDNGEIGIPNILVTATGGGSIYYAWTDYLGNYEFDYIPAGTYIVQVSNNYNLGYTTVCNNNQTAVLSGATETVNFGISCSGTYDVAITHISLMNGFFPGVGDAILPHIGMLNGGCSTTAVSGKVIIVLDACIDYSTSGYSFNNAPDVVIPTSTGDTLIWNVADINSIGTFGYWDYAVNTLTCTSAQVGDTACITVMVLPTNGDADMSNNTLTQCFEIGVSYDPNNKEVLPAGLGTQGFIPADEPSLTYTINFQNTGTAVARNIYVMDTIDTDLDFNSIEILNASHRMQAYSLPNRAVKFMFPDIMLPDSTHDERNSHGYVTFKIRLNAGLTPGTPMENTGHIYFDYNEAIVTNTTLNTIEFPSSISEMAGSIDVKVYPNPANDVFTVFTNQTGVSTIVVTDMLGKTVKQLIANDSRTEIDAMDMQSGVYFIRVTQGSVSTTQKVVISK